MGAQTEGAEHLDNRACRKLVRLYGGGTSLGVD